MRAVFFLALLLLSGCAAGNRLSASHEDYRLYRETRLAASLEERLGASHRYLARMPDGKWAPEVRRWFRRAERKYYEAAFDSAPRLRAYLRAMPDGPHAAAATRRLVELETAAGFDERRTARELRAARRVQSNLALAAEERRRFVRDIVGWLERLAAIQSYGEPTSALDGDFLLHFRLKDAAAECDDSACRKQNLARYQIPSGGTLVEREATYEVKLVLEEGVLTRAVLSGPELFSRLGEAIELRAVANDDPQGRIEAIGASLSLLMNALEVQLPAAECEVPPVSPVVLARTCRGRRVSAIAGGDGELDVVTFEPVPREAGEGSDGG